MIDTPCITETVAQPLAFIHLTIPRDEIRHVMDPGLSEILAALADQCIEPSGPRLTHHLRIAPEIFDFEICVPVETPVRPVGRVQAGQWPAMTVARAVYEGPYGGLPRAWKEFNDWVADNGHSAAGDLWERYVSRPPRASRTELIRPIAS